MKNNFLILALFFLLVACQSNDQADQTKAGIDIESVADSLELFGKGLISTALYERDLAIHPEGKELIYTLSDYKQTRRCLLVMNKENGQWLEPKILSISGKYQDIEPFYAQDGHRLYFASNRPIYGDTSRQDYNLWYSDREKGDWSEPVPLDSIINTRGDEFYPSLSENGNLYFTASRENGMGREDIFRSTPKNGSYTLPEPLPGEINTPLYEFNAYINPAEDLLVFSSYGREDGLGGGDLYLSRKDDQGHWSQSRNLGELINSDKLDYCPFIDWPNRNFYFTSERMVSRKDDIKTVDEMKQIANDPLNGFGNIYKIGLDRIIYMKYD